MKKLFSLLLIGLLALAPAAIAREYPGLSSPFNIPLITAKTTTGTGNSVDMLRPAPRSYFAVVTGTGSVSATVYIEVSNDGTNWLTGASSLCTLNLSGTTTAMDGCAIPAAQWLYIRANVGAISGTGATVNVYMGG